MGAECSCGRLTVGILVEAMIAAFFLSRDEMLVSEQVDI